MPKEVTDRTGPFAGPFWDHLRAAGEEMKAAARGLVPPSVHEHRRAAQREILLGFRELVDAALERVEEREPPTATQVKVEKAKS